MCWSGNLLESVEEAEDVRYFWCCLGWKWRWDCFWGVEGWGVCSSILEAVCCFVDVVMGVHDIHQYILERTKQFLAKQRSARAHQSIRWILSKQKALNARER